MIRGRLTPIETGTRVSVTMFIHPAVAAFIFVGCAVLMHKSQGALAGMFVIGVALLVGAFFPEAIKAKRLLVAVLKPTPQPYISATPIG